MWREIFGLEKKTVNLVDLITPRRSFSEVILPEETRQQLYEALTQIEKHRLIFSDWGLGERHPTGLGLAFNFAGPPGTGKTICAEAIAYSLGRKLMRVRYSELESCWAGDTGKNIRTVFREAKTAEAVLFFDEADSVAARRFSNIQMGYEREANQSVNILLKEVEEHDGVVIFATNMASNFDPAFERRIRIHILFRMPSVTERERIWQVQVHPEKTPLADDVDFLELAQRFEASGGEIRNAVLRAAQMAAGEEGPDEAKRLHLRHFAAGMQQVLAAKRVMQQTVANTQPELLPWQSALDATEERLKSLDGDLHSCRTELGMLVEDQAGLASRLEEERRALAGQLDALDSKIGRAVERVEAAGSALDELRGELSRSSEATVSALARWEGEQAGALDELKQRLTAQEAHLAHKTLLPWPRPAVLAGLLVLALLLLALGGVGAKLLL